MATYSNILAWRIPWTDESDGLQSITICGVTKSWTQLSDQHFHFSKPMLSIVLNNQYISSLNPIPTSRDRHHSYYYHHLIKEKMEVQRG